MPKKSYSVSSVHFESFSLKFSLSVRVLCISKLCPFDTLALSGILVIPTANMEQICAHNSQSETSTL